MGVKWDDTFVDTIVAKCIVHFYFHFNSHFHYLVFFTFRLVSEDIFKFQFLHLSELGKGVEVHVGFLT